MHVDTGAFTALRDQVAALETEVAGLREAVVFTDALGDCIYERGYQHGRESILGASAMPPASPSAPLPPCRAPARGRRAEAVMTGGCFVKPAGYAATAAEFLDEAAAGDGRDVAVHQLAALQGIGWALLALGEQLADVADADADCATRLSGIADAVDGLHREPAGRLRGLPARFLPGRSEGRP